MSAPVINVLFLCTGNSARSVMSEALLTSLGNGRFQGYSAGSHPTGQVNPFAIEQIRQFDPSYRTDDLRSKSWNDFASPGAPKMDVIITVCDNAAGETCPYWPGRPATAHWGYADPAAVEGSDEAKRAAFAKTFDQIRRRIEAFTALPIEAMSFEAVSSAAKKIGEMAV
ncbi:MAG: arsenate reductase ArsC [Burkholderiaceae bacterium]|nr:arsenate reductase ArsC [Burkholderiaceae bacterium]